ncbi:MAG: heavy metal translocating P-type ATPase [Nitrospiraceae bacterium]|nr:heavy metal translocating P-type ATPase [Nitrospiraceae bacterium]
MPRCDHCLRDFPPRETVEETIDGKPLVFCCHGCSGIYRLIHAEGLDTFYRKRKWDETGIEISALGRDIDTGLFEGAVKMAGDRNEIDIYIDGIRCASCVWLNEKILSRTPGVADIRVNYATHRARIHWDPAVIGLAGILGRIQSIGYIPKPYSESGQALARKAEARDMLIRLGTAGFVSSQIMIYSIALYAGYFQGIDSGTRLLFELIAMLLTIPVLFYSGGPLIRSTLNGLGHLRFNMDSLIVIGSGSAFLYSVYAMFRGGEVYFDTAVMIITLILTGRYIELQAKGRASETITRLAALTPREVRLVPGTEAGKGERKKVPVADVRRGDFVEVIPGERIPLDGIVAGGASEADESIITGESRPVNKEKGSKVIGGSINLYGTIVFEVTHAAGETVLSGIIRAVEDAQAARPKIQAIADRVVGIFVPSILVIATATISGYLAAGSSVHHAVMTGISVLVIACPCSLGLATPLAVLLFTTMASSRGVLVKSGDVIERTSQITDVLFDKTGTLTRGKPLLRKTVVFDPSLDAGQVIGIAAALEGLSEHSIARAIAAGSPSSPTASVCDFRAVPGRGIVGAVEGLGVHIGNRAFMADSAIVVPQEAARAIADEERSGDTVVYVGWNGSLRAIMVISDILREEVPAVVRQVARLGIGLTVISGDNRRTTEAIAAAAGIRSAIWESTPTMKRDHIAGLQHQNRRIMMVGDGINDAPALTLADVGLAMGRGTDIAIESADALLLRNDLHLVPFLLQLARKTQSIIRQNIFWAFFYNLLAIPLAVAGILHPIVAAAAMAASSLFVVANSLRIRSLRTEGGG